MSIIHWFDIPSQDLLRAIEFYSKIFDIKIRMGEHLGRKLGFFPVEGRKDVAGAILAPESENTPSRTGTRVYFRCEGRLNGVLSRVEPAGGRILQDKVNIGDAGWIAFIEDTEGNVIGLHGNGS